MKFVLLLYGDDSSWAELSAEEMAESMAVWEAFDRELTEAGVFLGGEGLTPTAEATTVRMAGGEVVHTDGPFAETREQLGGFYLLDCKDLDEALGWAAKVPDLAEDGSVEVRAVLDYDAIAAAGQSGSEATTS
jgi:hypothetical protein